jgi:long-chain acyl-CoA synthetase
MGSWARRDPERPAIISARRTISFGATEERQQKIAGALFSAGLTPGDRIGVWSPNRPEVLEVVLAALRAGLVPVPINALLTPRERDHQIVDSGLRALFPVFSPKPTRYEEPPMVIHLDDGLEELIDGAPSAPLHDFVIGRPMHYTSGTTGAPKGVYAAGSPGTAEGVSQAFRTLWGIEQDEVHLVCSPLAHSAPLRFSIRTLEAGGRVIVQERFDPLATLDAIEEHRVTSTFMVPTHLERILELGAPEISKRDLTSLRTLAHAGAPIRESSKRAIIDLFPEGSVWEFYGSTEGQATRISTAEWLNHPGSVGRALPGIEVWVESKDQAAAPPGTVGRVWVRPPESERFEYWRDPAKTTATWRGDSFTAGDLGYLDGGGYLYLVGRLHDTIITGGVNVYPQEVEAILCEHPDIAEAMVYGAPDDEWGQKVCAQIVGAPGASTLTPEQIRAWARDKLAPYKIPRAIELVDELARTPTGKLKRP